MIAPTEAQCDSPYVVTLKSVPKVDMMLCFVSAADVTSCSSSSEMLNL